MPDESMEELIQSALKSSQQMVQTINMGNVAITVTFGFKGHLIAVNGLNPDLVFSIVEKIKANDKILTEIKGKKIKEKK